MYPATILTRYEGVDYRDSVLFMLMVIYVN
jgi:hypothetical protein